MLTLSHCTCEGMGSVQKYFASIILHLIYWASRLPKRRHVHIQKHRHTHTDVHPYVRTHTHSHPYVHTDIHTHIFRRTCATYTCRRVCTQTHMHLHTFTHTDTHAYTKAQTHAGMHTRAGWCAPIHEVHVHVDMHIHKNTCTYISYPLLTNEWCVIEVKGLSKARQLGSSPPLSNCTACAVFTILFFY